MRLFASLVPPREVLDHLHDVVEGVRAPSEQMAATAPGRHAGESRVRLFHRRHDEPLQAEGTTRRELDVVEPGAMHLPITRFGNLTLNEAAMLVHTLQREAATWPTPRLRLAGGAALEWPGDQCVWVGVTGESELLEQIARALPQAARTQQLFVDRRGFRPLLKVGTINDHTTAPYLEALVAELEAYESPTWVQHELSLVVIPPDSDDRDPSPRPFRTVRLGAEDAEDAEVAAVVEDAE